MSIKWIGAILIIAGCGGMGFSMAAVHKKEERILRQLIGALDYMECDLQYHLTPLPDLCQKAGREDKGMVGKIMLALSRELENQTSADVESCMNLVLASYKDLPKRILDALRMMGASLGRFDLEGQVKGLESVRNHCRRELEGLRQNRDTRLRSYQTLGLCAGAALAILFV